MSKEFVDEDQLEDLDQGAVVIDSEGTAWQKIHEYWYAFALYHRTSKHLVEDFGPIHLVWGGE